MSLTVVNTQSIGGLPSGYMSFPLEIYGKSMVQGHGFELEGTLTDKESIWYTKDSEDTTSYLKTMYLDNVHIQESISG